MERRDGKEGKRPPEATEDAVLLIRPEEAARQLGIGRTTVYGLLRTGRLRSVSIGRCRRIPAPELQRFSRELELARPAHTPSVGCACPRARLGVDGPASPAPAHEVRW